MAGSELSTYKAYGGNLLGKDVRLRSSSESPSISPKAETTSPSSYPRNKHTLLDLFDRDCCYPVFKNLCPYLGIGEIVALTRTCKKLSNLYQILLKRQWDVDAGLCRFVDDPLQFRSQLRKHSAIISGSFALQFFERVVWEVSDLDIYARAGLAAIGLAEYLCEAEGYNLQLTSTGEEMYVWSHAVQVWHFPTPLPALCTENLSRLARTLDPSNRAGQKQRSRSSQLEIIQL